ncbi:MAG: LPS export ABC transporter periplasmic protein LptC [Brevinematales bacterium]|nr:LPS export ABC transporter periplasmic protein LptC [Brevinematales bacterium]
MWKYLLVKIPFLSLLILGCYYDIEPPIIKVEPKVGTNNVLLVSKEFKYLGTDIKRNTKSWELISERSVVYKNNEVELENINIKFFKEGRIVSELKGNKGKLFSKQNKAEVYGNVTLQNYENKTTIYTSRLIWDANTRTIYNSRQDKTTIVSSEGTLKGTGLRTTPEVYPLELENVEAVIQ